ncbi:hypothetical protein [Tsukamurella hominis]|uniref:hypothetical protein n=1 Tax=Tsukamurella hominis TaxID=1970232 RepID=UPI0039ECE79F
MDIDDGGNGFAPTTLVWMLRHWNRAIGYAVVHSAALSLPAVDAQLDRTAKALDAILLPADQQARFYTGSESAAEVDIPLRQAMRAGYRLFSRGTAVENVTQFGARSFDDYLTRWSLTAPATDRAELPRPSQIEIVTLETALQRDPAVAPAQAMLDAATFDPLNTAADVLRQQQHVLPESAQLERAALQPGDVITWSSAEFGLVLADGLVYCATDATTCTVDQALARAGASAWNLSRPWPWPWRQHSHTTSDESTDALLTSPQNARRLVDLLARTQSAIEPDDATPIELEVLHYTRKDHIGAGTQAKTLCGKTDRWARPAASRLAGSRNHASDVIRGSICGECARIYSHLLP